MVAMGKSLFSRWLVYYVTWFVTFMLVPVRLVTAALLSNVACARFVKASLVPTRLLFPYITLCDVCCRSQRLAWDLMKWYWTDVQDLLSFVLHA